MAQKRTTRTKGLKKTPKKDQYFRKIKILNKYLLEQDENLLNHLVDGTTEETKQLMTRCIRVLVNHPKILTYVDKYLNHLFMNPDPKDWFRTFGIICKSYGITTANQLFYGKYISFDNTLGVLLNTYYKEFNLPPLNQADINALTILYNNGIINEDHIESINQVLNVNKKPTGTTQKKTSSKFVLNTNQQNPQEIIPLYDNLSEKIKGFIQNVQSYITNRFACKNCPLFRRGNVVIETNVIEPGPVDIIIFGLYPSNEDIKNQIPFSSNEDLIFRTQLKSLTENHNLSYVTVNIVLCNASSEKEITKQQMLNCKNITDEILKQFPSKLIVLTHNKLLKLYNIKGGIAKNDGKIFNNVFCLNNIKINDSEVKAFERLKSSLDILMTTLKQSVSVSSTVNVAKFRIPEDKLITKFGPHLTLFDIQLLGEQIIYIMKDSAGKKKYLIDKIKFPIYIKTGQYKDCNFIQQFNDSMNIAYLSAEELNNFNKKMYYLLKKHTKGA